MQIRITFITSDETPQATKGKGQPYSQLEVTYKDDKGQTKSRKIMSFANPAVFATLKAANKGDVFDVEMVKNGDFWNWTSVTAVDDSRGATTLPGTSTPRSTNGTLPTSPGRNNYETTEERALRQRLIVRQSSITAALAFHKNNEDANLEEVLDTAEFLHDWVYKKPDLFDQPNDIDSDIPF